MQVDGGNLFDLLHEPDGSPRRSAASGGDDGYIRPLSGGGGGGGGGGPILPLSDALGMALEVCRGMAYLHGAVPPLLHRDIKSSNLLCGGPAERSIKICDFGLSRASTTTQSPHLNLITSNAGVQK